MMMDVNACVFREVESDGNFLNDVAHDQIGRAHV